MDIICFSILFILFLIKSILVGKFTADKIDDGQDYYLSGRKIGIIGLSLTFLSTQLGGGAIIGAADAAYKSGWPAIYYGLGISLGLLGLALGLGKRLRQYNISTIAQIFQVIYKDRILYFTASIIYVIATFLILVAISVATRKYLASLGFNHVLIFFLFWCAFIYYTSLGGLKAVVQTDKFQIVLVLLVFLITFLMLKPLPISTHAYMTQESIEYIPWSSWLLMPFLFTLIGQDMGQRCFAGKTPYTVTIAAFCAGILFLLASLLPIYLGILAKNLNIDLTEGQSVLMSVVLQLTNPYMAAFFAFAVLMAIVSTADSLLCALSSNIALDLIAVRVYTKNTIYQAKIVTFLAGVMAFILGFFSNDIIPLMVGAYELTIVSFFVPIIMGILLKNPSKTAARMACMGGLFCFVLFRVWPIAWPKELISLFVSLTCFMVGMLITKYNLFMASSNKQAEDSLSL